MSTDLKAELTPALATIDLGALRQNLSVVRRRAPGLSLYAVVKANAYGHGAVRIAEELSKNGVNAFGVATLPEAIELRQSGIEGRILVFAAPLPHHLPYFVQFDIEVTVPSLPVASAVMDAARTVGRISAHVKVDTGMGRIGMTVADAVETVRLLDGAPGVDLVGLWTHFATADEQDHPLVSQQLTRFDEFMEALGSPPAPVHLGNSGALFTQSLGTEVLHGARVGISLYGMYDPPAHVAPERLKPIMTLRAPITQIKTVDPGTPVSYGAEWVASRRTRIGTVAIGYADGYRRILSNRAQVGVRDTLVDVAGRVCMDMIMIDLGPAGVGPEAEVGTEAVLFGAGGPSVIQLARWCDTITYEVTCGLTARIHRKYVG